MSIRGGRGPRDSSDSGGYRNGYQRTGRYGRGPGDQRKYERYGGRGGGLGGILRFILFLALLSAGVLLVMVTVARPLVRAVVVPWADDNPAALRIPFVADMVREDIGAALTEPASGSADEITFLVQDGDTPQTIAPRLAEEEIVDSERAFLFQAREDDLASKLTAGRYALAGNLTPAQVVDGLVNNKIVVSTIDVPFREQLRLEQMTAKLEVTDNLPFDPKDFYDLVKKPTDALLGDYPWLLDPDVRPKGASLEGFLYPATYKLRVDAEHPSTAEELVRMMLDTFIDRVGEDRLKVPEKRGLTFYEILTLASIVEREAVLDDEKPKIAGVYQNRIDRKPGVRSGLLQADPTVIYGVDTDKLGAFSEDWAKYVFWTVPEGRLRDQVLPDALDAYNTYKYGGLPPGPIAAPTVSSIDAALKPDTKSGLKFFVAIPEGQGAHDFSKSLAEHEKKLAKYGY